MIARRALQPLLPVVWTLVPMYGVEKLANYYYFAGDPAFFTVSGLRLLLFISFVLVGSVGAGAMLRDPLGGAATQGAAVAVFFLLADALCDPRVCYSTGPDGLEPLRFGLFLFSLSVVGAAAGAKARGGWPQSGTRTVAVWLSGFFALAYYPVMYTFAGTRLLWWLSPWPVAATVLVASVPAAAIASHELDSWKGTLVPIAGTIAAFGVSEGIASAYISELLPTIALFGLAAVIGSLVGGYAACGRKGSGVSRLGWLMAVVLVLDLTMTVAVVPDAVVSVAPAQFGVAGLASSVASPVYAGAYMDSTAGHAFGAGVNVSFEGTDPSVIQEDNYLAGGIGIHAAGCCVDGVDYAYRFDRYLFHDGSQWLVASGWEACDDNAACGGHSWEVRLFLHGEPLRGVNVSSNVGLTMVWSHTPDGATIGWFYSVNEGQYTGFASFLVPRPENPDFNTGVIPGGTIGPTQLGSYFFQAGIRSAHPIGREGWKVSFTCPTLLNNGWGCAQSMKTLQGGDSYWKVIWRWGEDYADVGCLAQGKTISFSYSNSTMTSYQSLW